MLEAMSSGTNVVAMDGRHLLIPMKQMDLRHAHAVGTELLIRQI